MSDCKYTPFPRDERTLCASMVFIVSQSAVSGARTSASMTTFLSGMAGCILGSGWGGEWLESSRSACCCPSHPSCLALGARACLDCAPHSSGMEELKYGKRLGFGCIGKMGGLGACGRVHGVHMVHVLRQAGCIETPFDHRDVRFVLRSILTCAHDRHCGTMWMCSRGH